MKYGVYDFSGTNNNKLYKLLGRTKKSGTSLILPWPYSGAGFVFCGTGFIVSFGSYVSDSPVYLRVTVDGVSARYGISDGREKIIIEGLEEKEHTAEILRVTEGVTPLLLESIIITGDNPSITGRPKDKRLKIEFIGDSITCGYGVAAPSGITAFNTYEEDCTMSYAYVTARLLDADVTFAGASGKGIVANCLGNRNDMTLRQAYEWETPSGGMYDHSQNIPDIVVINAGTNDAWGGVGDEEFYNCAVEFIGEIRTRYPHAAILWVYGIMDTSKLGAIEKAVNAAKQVYGYNNIYFLPVENMGLYANEVGAVGHPNRNTALRVAPLLACKIKEILKGVAEI